MTTAGVTAGAGRGSGDRWLAGGALAVAALAWAALAWPGLLTGGHHGLGAAPGSGHPMADMPADMGPPSPAAPAVAAVLTGWVVMVVAMMLPPALPLLTTVRALAARRSRPAPVVGSAATAFVAVWTAAGAVLVAADAGLRAGSARVPALAGREHLAAGAVLLLAGAYQLSPLADRCLRACRAPRGFVARHWHGLRAPWREAGVVGAAYGLSCVGCCWALMAVSFAVGVAALPVMVALAVLMAAQRLLPHGRRLVRPTGAVLIALGGLAVLDLLPQGLLAT